MTRINSVINRVSFVTHADKNYACKLVALIQSLAPRIDDSVVLAFCHDEETYEVVSKLEYTNLIPHRISDLETEFVELKQAKGNRSHLEYLFCLTPYLIKYAMKVTSAEYTIYVDSDVYFFGDPKATYENLDGLNSVYMTPHRFTENNIQKSIYGKYNVGWIAFDSAYKENKALDWWAEKCLESTSVQKNREIFGDQKYLDTIHEIEPRIGTCEYEGDNLAPWNYSDEIYARLQYGVNYFHFSGLKLYDRYAVLGNSGYTPNVSKRLKKDLYRPYIAKLLEIEREYNIGTCRSRKKFTLKEICHIIFIRDLLFINHP